MGDLTSRQRALLDEWLGAWETVADHSWPLQDTTVLRVRNAAGDHIVKARTPAGIAAEIDAHLTVLSRLSIPAPRLEYHRADAGILVTGYLPGAVVEGTAAEWEPGTYRQAGVLLAAIQLPGQVSTDYAAQTLGTIRRRLAEAEGLVPAAQLAELGRRVSLLREHPVRMHFTHGDYQPRNWLIHEGTVGLIDFGRGGRRPWVSDLVRLRSQQFVGHPELEAAFLAGLGRPLADIGEADATALALETIRQAVGTVVWAHQIGDADFTEHGRRMIRRLLDGAVSA
jgi:tRNA A-37 threonylcarbamoyl transferase component Bud32